VLGGLLYIDFFYEFAGSVFDCYIAKELVSAAEQKIKVEPSEGSPAAIAFKLLEKIQYHDQRAFEVWNKEEILDVYAECLEAANGFRSLGAKTRR
jgi:hypothetical protein